MSFILDALRKSDARRQQSGAPGLNSPEPPRPPRRRRRGVLVWLAASLVLLAAVAAAVYVLRPTWLSQAPNVAEQARDSETPVDAPEPSESAADRRGADSADESSAEEDNSGRTGPEEADRADSVARETSEEQSDEGSESASRDRRAPVPASPERTVSREAPRRETVPVPAEEATEELERRIAEESDRRREEESTAREASTDDERSVRRRQSDSAEGDGSESAPSALNDGVAEYVQHWDLPLSVRRSLPELDLSIHVFSPDEAERFVLINGERYRSGDSIGEVEIVNINRDGAVVDFRSHRFLLAPR